MSFQLVPFQDVERMAVAIAKSNLFGMKTPEQALTLMLIAQAEGKHPASAARDYDIIQGRPAKKAEALLRDFIELGGKVDWDRYDDEVVTGTFSYKGSKPVTVSWDMKRAHQAELTGKKNWKTYPRQMLKARVISEAVRMVCPSATGGLYSVEEVSDMGKEAVVKEVVPAKVLVEPAPGNPNYVIKIGKPDGPVKGKKLCEVLEEELQRCVDLLVHKEETEGKQLQGDQLEFVNNAVSYLNNLEASKQTTAAADHPPGENG